MRGCDCAIKNATLLNLHVLPRTVNSDRCLRVLKQVVVTFFPNGYCCMHIRNGGCAALGINGRNLQLNYIFVIAI